MFDFSFGELTVCLLVALVVLGPEKLHGVIRGIGRLLGQARSYMRNLTDELERETELGEVKRQLEETKRMFREQTEEFRASVDSLRRDADAPAEETLSGAPEPLTSGESSTHVAMNYVAPDRGVACHQPISESSPTAAESEAQEHRAVGNCDTSENVTESDDSIGKPSRQGDRG